MKPISSYWTAEFHAFKQRRAEQKRFDVPVARTPECWPKAHVRDSVSYTHLTGTAENSGVFRNAWGGAAMTLMNRHHGAPARGRALSTATRAHGYLMPHSRLTPQHFTYHVAAPIRPATFRLTFGHTGEEGSKAGL